MKKNKMHFFAVAFLSLALGLSYNVCFASVSFSEESGAGKKWVSDTSCCAKSGARVGASNDCIRGKGNCVDNTCPTGTTEESSCLFE